MSLALVIVGRPCEELVRQIKQLEPDISIQIWPDIQHPETVKLAVLWQQPAGVLKSFTDLKAVTSLGAGVDFILNDPDLSKNIPVHRIVTQDLQQQMAQYVLCYILRDYRRVELYQRQQHGQQWKVTSLPESTTIGFLGLGEIGSFVAKQCQNIGFDIVGYTHRSQHQGIDCFHQEEGLKHVMQNSDVIVCLLPLTQSTKHLLNIKRFAYCKKKPLLIQVGRGEQLVEKDLLQALDQGLIRHAVLDVFPIEPLPKNHSFWQRKDITITPHNSARADVMQTAKAIVRRYLSV